MKIPRGSAVQRIKVVNSYPEMARENNKLYPDALVRLTCSVIAVRRDLKAVAPYPEKDCHDFVETH